MHTLPLQTSLNPPLTPSPGEQEWEAIEAAQSAQGVASDGLESGVGSIMKDLMTSVPGIDEAMAFAELMKMVCGIYIDIYTYTHCTFPYPYPFPYRCKR
ncbi:hypothetical protein EON63_03190 [archaeon]|nr:MAG: hypothetical protein EON63_03190 [archaeon]